MNTVDVNGINLSYTRRGKGSVLLLVHGFPLDSSSWNEIIPMLENDFDVIAPDLRGFGHSTTMETAYTISDMADDLAGLLDDLKIGKAVIAGHSMGGYVALALAKKYPKHVSGLAMISSQSAGDPPDRKEGRYKTAGEVTEKGVGVVADAMTPKLSSNAHVQAFVRSVIEKQSKAGVVGALKAMAEREDLTSILSTFKFPVVLVHGDADALIPIDRSREMKAALPSAHYVELKGAGHMPMMEFTKETADALHHLAG